MLLLFFLPIAAILCAALLRRALPIVLAAASASIAWTLTHDTPATWLAALIALCVAAAGLDLSSSSSSNILRRIGIAAEAVCAGGVLAFAAGAILRQQVSGAPYVISVAFAGLIGIGIVLHWREPAHMKRHA